MEASTKNKKRQRPSELDLVEENDKGGDKGPKRMKRGKAVKVQNPDHTAQTYIKTELENLVALWPDDYHLFTDLSTEDEGRKKTLKLPRTAGPTSASWTKVCAQISKDIMNSPKSRDDCWYVPASVKGGGSGGGACHAHKNINTKLFGLHRITYLMLHPDETVDTITVHHRCGNGCSSELHGPVCINPYHTKNGFGVGAKGNRDDEGCRYGFKPRCPHTPPCIWTDKETGRFIPCVNDGKSPNECHCTPSCYK